MHGENLKLIYSNNLNISLTFHKIIKNTRRPTIMVMALNSQTSI